MSNRDQPFVVKQYVGADTVTLKFPGGELEVAEEREEVEDFARSMNALADDRDQLQARVADLEDEVGDLEDEVAYLEDEVAELRMGKNDA